MHVGIGATMGCISLHTMRPALVKKMKPELKGLHVFGATIHFNPGKPIPEELITKIVVRRKKENEDKSAAQERAEVMHAWHDDTAGSSGLQL